MAHTRHNEKPIFCKTRKAKEKSVILHIKKPLYMRLYNMQSEKVVMYITHEIEKMVEFWLDRFLRYCQEFRSMTIDNDYLILADKCHQPKSFAFHRQRIYNEIGNLFFDKGEKNARR